MVDKLLPGGQLFCEYNFKYQAVQNKNAGQASKPGSSRHLN
jgi:hypothetical protein